MDRRLGALEDSAPALEKAVGVLRQFRSARRPLSREVEHCELCSIELAEEHPHLVELRSHQLVCACDPCALLFDGRQRSQYRRVSRRIVSLPGFRLSDQQWESLIIPIDLAFFFRSSLEGRTIALYPSPAGAVESQLSLEAWTAIAESNPQLAAMEPDIEALLVNRIGHAQGSGRESVPAYFIAPIDECYRLVGLLRTNWKGLSGGAEVWELIHGFFAHLQAKAQPAMGGANA